jgi:hypothetical protein
MSTLAAKKKIQLANQAAQDAKEKAKTALKMFQEELEEDVMDASGIPCRLSNDRYSEHLLTANVDYTGASQWLRDQGLCLRLVWWETGNNDIVQSVEVDYYESRGYADPRAFAHRERYESQWTFY